MALPAIALLFCFSYMPMYGIVIAFKKYKVKYGIWGSPWMKPLFRNFEILFRKNSAAINAIKNTLCLNFLFIILDYSGYAFFRGAGANVQRVAQPTL